MPEPEFQIFTVQTDDGLTLYGRDYGRDEGQQLPVVCLSGLSRNGRDFHPLALKLIREGRRTVTLDYRGRGLSGWDVNTENYNIVREAQDVSQALDSLSIERAVFIGTSRGGLILHILVSMIPNRLATLVLNDIGPVIERDGLRRIRDYLSARTEPSNEAEAARHLKAIHGEEFPALTETDWNDMADAIYRKIDGRLVADFDPALIKPLTTMDFSVPLPDLWKQYDGFTGIPSLIIRGENSRLLSTDTLSDMLARHPTAHAITALGQGHAPLLHIDNVYEKLGAFIRSCP